MSDEIKDINFEVNLNILKEYIEEYAMFPRSKVIFRGTALGQWFYKLRRNKNNLSEYKIEALNKVNKYWNAEKLELEKENKRLLEELYSKCKAEIPIGNTPIDEVYNNDEKIRFLLRYKIYDCESLVNNHGIFKYCTQEEALKIYSKVLHIDFPYLKIIHEIFAFDCEKIENVKNLLNTFCFKSNEELYEKIKTIINKLDEKEKFVLVFKYGINDGIYKTTTTVANSFGSSPPRITKILQNAISTIRDYNYLEILFKTNSSIDYYGLNNKTKAFLYREGIRTRKQLKNLLQFSSTIDDDIKNDIVEKVFSVDEIYVKNISIDKLNLSSYTYDVLKWLNIGKVGDIDENFDNFEQYRYLSEDQKEEIKSKLTNIVPNVISPNNIPVDSLPIEELELSVKSYKALKYLEIEDISIDYNNDQIKYKLDNIVNKVFSGNTMSEDDYKELNLSIVSRNEYIQKIFRKIDTIGDLKELLAEYPDIRIKNISERDMEIIKYKLNNFCKDAKIVEKLQIYKYLKDQNDTIDCLNIPSDIISTLKNRYKIETVFDLYYRFKMKMVNFDSYYYTYTNYIEIALSLYLATKK